VPYNSHNYADSRAAQVLSCGKGYDALWWETNPNVAVRVSWKSPKALTARRATA
jgi:hypothetical protein